MIFASNNKGKLNEIKSILKDFDIKSLKEAELDIDVIEDQDSFYGNALKKAREIYNIKKEPVIADDSGLCINVLDNWPGVLTHRFLGDDATEYDRNAYIIEKMSKERERSAKFICTLVYYDGENILVGEGTLEGEIAKERKGENGFGFDEIFLLPNGKTLAELESEDKDKISARFLAAKDLKEKLSKLKG